MALCSYPSKSRSIFRIVINDFRDSLIFFIVSCPPDLLSIIQLLDIVIYIAKPAEISVKMLCNLKSFLKKLGIFSGL